MRKGCGMGTALTGLNPDFVFLQEVQAAHRRKEQPIHSWPDEPQFEYIAQTLWPRSFPAIKLALRVDRVYLRGVRVCDVA